MGQKVRMNGGVVEIDNPAWLARINEAADSPPKRTRQLLPETVARRLRVMGEWEREQAAGPGVFLAMYLRNPVNRKAHWTVDARERRAARANVAAALAAARTPKALPVRAVMTRYGPRKLDKGCGLNTALKPIRDGIADYFGLADDDGPEIEWDYPDPVKSPEMCFGIRVEIFPKPSI